MTLRDKLRDLAETVPPARVPPDLFDRARRRYRRRRVAAVTAIVLATVLVGGLVVTPLGERSPSAGTAVAGLPDRLVVPRWWTDTVRRSPNGPVSVAFNGNSPQADHEDYRWAFWRDGYTIEPTVVVGLHRDTYRIVRGAQWVGVNLSPDGRYLIWELNGLGGGRAEMLDLTTGTVHPLADVTGAGSPLGWSVDGRKLLVVDHEWAVVVSWPSGRIDWRVRYRSGTTADDPSSATSLALSPGGSMLAVETGQQIRVYRRDGTMLWKVAWSGERLGGHAAWRDDRLLAMLRPAAPACLDCPGPDRPVELHLWTH